jgi:hypothetical protein
METEEPALPYTPSNTGRRAQVGYLGFSGVAFNDLWPLFLGIAATVTLSLDAFIGGGMPRLGWVGRTVASLLPIAAGYGYLRFLVMGRPPHYRGDLASLVLCLRPDFTDPPFRWLPLVPRIRAEATDSPGPSRLPPAHPLRTRAAR